MAKPAENIIDDFYKKEKGQGFVTLIKRTNEGNITTEDTQRFLEILPEFQLKIVEYICAELDK